MALDPTKKKILAMLDDDGAEPAVRAAAAIVLGELHVTDRPVVAALCATIASPDRELKLAGLRGLRGARARIAVPLLVGLLDDRDEDVRRAAAAAVGAAGPEAAADLKKQLPSATAARRRAIVDVLAWSPGGPGLDTLVEIIGGDDAGLAVHAGQALRQRVGELSAADAAKLRRRLLGVVAEADKKAAKAAKGATGATGAKGAKGAKGASKAGKTGGAGRAKDGKIDAAASRPEGHAPAGPGAVFNFTGLAVALRLVGEIGDAEDLKLLAARAAPGSTADVRAAALAGMRKPFRAAPAKARAALVDLLLALVGEDDLDRVVRPALDLLRDAEIGLDRAGALLKLAEGGHPVAREFALGRLGAMDTAQVGRVLVKHLATGDQTSREAAAASLRRAPGAVGVLVNELLEAPDAEAARWIAGVLRHHAARLQPAHRQAIGKAAATWAKSGDARAVPVAELLGTVDPEAREDALMDTAKKLAAQGKFDEAAQTVRALRGEGLSADTRFEAALYAFKASPRPAAGRGLRESDAAFAELRRLSHTEFPLVDRLFKSKHLDEQERFLFGFSFIESADAFDRDLGAEILRRIAKESPRSAVGKSARNKLELAKAGDEDDD